MKLELAHGDTVEIAFEDTDGHVTVNYKGDLIEVTADMEDNAGRYGTLYRESLITGDQDAVFKNKNPSIEELHKLPEGSVEGEATQFIELITFLQRRILSTCGQHIPTATFSKWMSEHGEFAALRHCELAYRHVAPSMATRLANSEKNG